ncbi:MAG: nitrogenase iron-molybdenum cofactor biosynthesis protein NifN, partial [Nitrospirae bacterium]|nr:nitrogenase iron-molybdenum cofactor biosynthesis protein NifN [Nitrospirota bacterium]
HVIGTGEPPFTTDCDINLIGEYNIAGDLWLIEPVLEAAGIRVLSRISGNSSFEEITYAHRARLNVVVCSRALINVAREMERKYGIPYVEVSFFGRTEMSKALRMIASKFDAAQAAKIESVIKAEEEVLDEKLKRYGHLKGKKAVLYTGGVKSWSFISTLSDLGFEVGAVGTKKSTYEDEKKMRELLGTDAPLVEDVNPKSLLKLLKERNADILIAGGRNQYLAVKEGFPFVDVNQERHTPYAGYAGLASLAEQIDNSIRFYDKSKRRMAKSGPSVFSPSTLALNPLKHSQTIGAAIALQGIDRALPVIHGAQGCTFLAKVLLTKHFREPIALAGTKQFAEDVIMGSEKSILSVISGFLEKQQPAVLGILSSGLSETKGDDIAAAAKHFAASDSGTKVISIATPDYNGGLETGYAAAVMALTGLAECDRLRTKPTTGKINVLACHHLTPADFLELRDIIESFGLHPVMLPDLSALDGSRQGFSALASGGTGVDEIMTMNSAEFTLAIGMSMEPPAARLKERFGIEYKVLESITGLHDSDILMETLSMLSGKGMPPKYARQRNILIDGMRDAHFYFGNKKVTTALEPDLSVQVSRWLSEMGADVALAIIPQSASGGAASEGHIQAREVIIGDLWSIRKYGHGKRDLIISNSHCEDTARDCGIPLYQMGFPLYKILGGNTRITIGYRGTLTLTNDVATILAGTH